MQIAKDANGKVTVSGVTYSKEDTKGKFEVTGESPKIKIKFMNRNIFFGHWSDITFDATGAGTAVYTKDTFPLTLQEVKDFLIITT